MKSELEDFDGDTDADLAAYVQVYRTRIADMTDEIDAKERERLEQIKDEQKRRAAEAKG